MELSRSSGLGVASEGSGASVCLVLGLQASLQRAVSCAVVFSLTSLLVVGCAPFATRVSQGRSRQVGLVTVTQRVFIVDT